MHRLQSEHVASYMLHLTPCILHFSSYTLHPTHCILHFCILRIVPYMVPLTYCINLLNLCLKNLLKYLRNLSNITWKIYQNNKRNLSNTKIFQLQKTHYVSPYKLQVLQAAGVANWNFCKAKKNKGTSKQASKRANKQANKVTSSLLELLVAAKNLVRAQIANLSAYKSK